MLIRNLSILSAMLKILDLAKLNSICFSSLVFIEESC